MHQEIDLIRVQGNASRTGKTSYLCEETDCSRKRNKTETKGGMRRERELRNRHGDTLMRFT